MWLRPSKVQLRKHDRFRWTVPFVNIYCTASLVKDVVDSVNKKIQERKDARSLRGSAEDVEDYKSDE